VVGIKANVFFSGMPNEAAGPVAETSTPTVISAWASVTAPTESSAATRDFILIDSSSNENNVRRFIG
jgi:hypothetical protein